MSFPGFKKSSGPNRAGIPDEDFLVVTRAIDIKDWDGLSKAEKEGAARDLWSRTLEIASTTTETQSRYLRDWPDIMRRSAALEKWERRVGHVLIWSSLPFVIFLSWTLIVGAKQRHMKSWVETGWDNAGLSDIVPVYDALLIFFLIHAGFILFYNLIVVRFLWGAFGDAGQLGFQLKARLIMADEIFESLREKAGSFWSRHPFEGHVWVSEFRTASEGVRTRLKYRRSPRYLVFSIAVIFSYTITILPELLLLKGTTDIPMHWIIFCAVAPIGLHRFIALTGVRPTVPA